MLVCPFLPSLAQRFESGLTGLALGCLANQSLTPDAIDRYWDRLDRNIDEIGHLDRPLRLPALPSSQEEGEWSVLTVLPWLWVLLEDEAGQQIWLREQPDPRLALLLQGFTYFTTHFKTYFKNVTPLSRGFSHKSSRGFSHEPSRGFSNRPSHPLAPLLTPFPTAQAVWEQAVHLIQNGVPLAEGLKHWQTDLSHLPPDLNAIGIALWLTGRSDHAALPLALAQQVHPYSVHPYSVRQHSISQDQVHPDRINPDSTIAPFFSPPLFCFAGLFGGFAFPCSESPRLGLSMPADQIQPDLSILQQYSDRLFRAWAGGL